MGSLFRPPALFGRPSEKLGAELNSQWLKVLLLLMSVSLLVSSTRPSTRPSRMRPLNQFYIVARTTHTHNASLLGMMLVITGS